MRRRSDTTRNLILFTGAALMLAPVLAFGQNAGPVKSPVPAGRAEVPDSGEAVFSSETRRVPLNVTVTDKAGHLVNNLTEANFMVLENGQPQKIKLFAHEDVPVSLGLIIDNSGSMRDKRSSVESAALALVRDSNSKDETFVVNFNDEAYLDAPSDGTPFTSDIKVLEQGLTRIDSRGGTAMRDAMKMSVDHLQEKAHRNKKVILIVTDGNDNASATSLEALVRLAQQDDVLVYAIGLLSEEEKKEAKKARRAIDLLVESTGGLAFYPKDVTEVEKIAHEVARDIRNQYSIIYEPTNTALDGSFRQVKVVVKAAGNPLARTRQGYYATSETKKRQ